MTPPSFAMRRIPVHARATGAKFSAAVRIPTSIERIKAPSWVDLPERYLAAKRAMDQSAIRFSMSKTMFRIVLSILNCLVSGQNASDAFMRGKEA
jgi:hypothetical protein